MLGIRFNRFALCTGVAILAILVQALIPLLLAAEIDAADAGSPPICSVADHIADGPNSGPSGDRHKSGGIGVCPICVTLHASIAVITPMAAVLPLPSQAGSIGVAPRPQRVPVALAAASYRSRAPPVG